MNLTFLSKTDKELNSMRDWHNSIGKQVRQEIKRRNLCSYSDGTLHRISKKERPFLKIALKYSIDVLGRSGESGGC